MLTLYKMDMEMFYLPHDWLPSKLYLSYTLFRSSISKLSALPVVFPLLSPP